MASEHRLIIGRDPLCDVVINDPYASPRHAALIWVRDPGVVQVMDLGSTNGVWLNRDRVWGRRLITSTDTLLVGRTQVDVGLLLLKLAYARGIAEGLRQATEGWEREWAIVHAPGRLPKAVDDVHEARNLLRLAPGRQIAVRPVGKWTAPLVRHASPYCACGINDAGARFIDPICRLVGPWEPAPVTGAREASPSVDGGTSG